MNRRQFLSRIPMIGAAIVAAPAVIAATAVKPELAMGGVLAPGEPYLIGESACEYMVGESMTTRLDFYREQMAAGMLTVDDVRRMEYLPPIGDAKRS